MLVRRTLITLVPLISAGCVGFRRCVSRICVPVCQAIPRAPAAWGCKQLSEKSPFLPRPTDKPQGTGAVLPALVRATGGYNLPMFTFLNPTGGTHG